MAAYNPHEKPTHPELRVLLTDKDNTLVHYGDDNGIGFPINPEQHRPIFTCIRKNPQKYLWVMLSRGGGGMKTRQQANVEIDNDKTLDIFRREILRDSFTRVHAKDGGDSGKEEKENFFCANNYRSSMRKIFDEVPGVERVYSNPDSILAKPQLGVDRLGLIERGRFITKGGENYLSDGETDYPIGQYLDLKFANNIVYRFYLKEIFENRSLHEAGDNKFIQSLEGMAVAGVAVLPNDKMRGIGIELIACGDAKTIEAAQVFGWMIMRVV